MFRQCVSILVASIALSQTPRTFTGVAHSLPDTFHNDTFFMYFVFALLLHRLSSTPFLVRTSFSLWAGYLTAVCPRGAAKPVLQSPSNYSLLDFCTAVKFKLHYCV